MNFKVVNNMESIEKSRASAGAYVRVIKVGVALHSSPHGPGECVQCVTLFTNTSAYRTMSLLNTIHNSCRSDGVRCAQQNEMLSAN